MGIEPMVVVQMIQLNLVVMMLLIVMICSCSQVDCETVVIQVEFRVDWYVTKLVVNGLMVMI